MNRPPHRRSDAVAAYRLVLERGAASDTDADVVTVLEFDVDDMTGEEIAVVLSGSGYAFLVLRRVDYAATPAVTTEADAALFSFRAKN